MLYVCNHIGRQYRKKNFKILNIENSKFKKCFFFNNRILELLIKTGIGNVEDDSEVKALREMKVTKN